jgi:hypothetical protein
MIDAPWVRGIKGWNWNDPRTRIGIGMSNVIDDMGWTLVKKDNLNALIDLAKFADTRAVSRAAYPHACEEDKRLRDLVDAALTVGSPR